MRKTTRKLTAVLLSAVCTLTAALPAFSLECSAEEAPAEAAPVKEVSFTASEKLAALIEQIESGKNNLYLDENRKKPAQLAVGDREDLGTRYYAFAGSSDTYTVGKQCYIYSQAVYGTLFGEFPLHGYDAKTPYKHSVQTADFAETLTPEYLTAHGVMPGAYLRTTVETDGSYSSKSGHSMIILGYDRYTVHILEGNGDGNGLVQDVVRTYEQFNRIYITRKGRYVGHIVQPTAKYYKDNFGLVFADFPDAPPDEPLPVDGGEWPWEEGGDETTAPAVTETGAKTVTTVTAAAGTDGAQAVFGDVDADGEVTAYDASLALMGFNEIMLDYAPEERTLTPAQEKTADVDGDSVLTAFDASMILTYFSMANAGFDDVTWEEILPA